LNISLAALLFSSAVIILLLLFFFCYFRSLRPAAGTVEWIHMELYRPVFADHLTRHPFKLRDVPAVSALCIIYAALSVCGLFFGGIGSISAPEPVFPAGDAQPLWAPLSSLLTGIFGSLPHSGSYPGIVFGVIILAVTYIFIKNLTGRTAAALYGASLLLFGALFFVRCGTDALGACTALHFLLVFYFMYLYISAPEGTSAVRRIWPMLFCGIFLASGLAVSPTMLFALPGLLLSFIAGISAIGSSGGKIRTASVFAAALVFIVPAALSYMLLHLLPGGMLAGSSPLGDRFALLFGALGEMFSGFAAAFGSPLPMGDWWKWAVGLSSDTLKHSFGETLSAVISFGNPIVLWGGIMAMIVLVIRIFKQRDFRALLILLAYLSMLLPWAFIPAAGSISEYLPASLMLPAALSLIFEPVLARGGRLRFSVPCFAILSALVFAAYFPFMCAIPVPAVPAGILFGIFPVPITI